ncbi:NlpC/P60 family protein [Szabonella alba]|uniref:C40 family peptidase n=1 Tax=Szabonella alba TaxID=2804194 RepID=A0A8K0Y2M6_9RHOB|nr:NlpC/P60 family protein [Szabonella alba]MBL4918289.1 C40 family peptidase [Szabonella alba]
MNDRQGLIVAEARRWIGTPYQHQASALGHGADCLGLVRGVWRGLLGPEPVRVPPYSADWAEASGREVLQVAARHWLDPAPGAEVTAGDVLLFRMRQGRIAKHLGIASGPDRFIHAYSGHGVIESPLSTPWARRIVARYRFPCPEGAE